MALRLRRIGYLLLALLWLAVMALPVLAALLAVRGELRIGRPHSGMTLFLVQEADFQGAGVMWTRRSPGGSHCSQTSLRYLLWEGQDPGANTDYCQCFDPATGQPDPSAACET
ncbi:MAG: hypothetical protein ACRDHL_08630 [Candidatus Promineifilaceae bacterium]